MQQFMTRENFAKRLEKSEPIYLHETFYALMQGYDAVAQETDVQVGGSDQLFNIMTAGRKLQEANGQRPQIGMFVKILPGTDGVIKMSKSLGNHIPIMAAPEDMYGKVMSIPDSAIGIYFELATRYTPAQVDGGQAEVGSGVNPRDVKMELAREIVSIFHGDAAAQRARAALCQPVSERRCAGRDAGATRSARPQHRQCDRCARRRQEQRPTPNG